MNAFPHISDYFKSQGFTPFPFQRQAWENARAGFHQLIQCPTGAGKTLAATGAWIDTLNGTDASTGCILLYLTPLKAMTRDLELALKAPLHNRHAVLTRNGDSTAAERATLFRKPPAILLTTPESLSLILASPKAETLFATLRAVVVDEWHELWASKRGVQTQLCLARLKRIAPTLRITALSATLKTPERALAGLLPVGDTGQLVSAPLARDIRLTVIEPSASERLPWAGHLGLALLKPVADALVRGQTTLVFTNTRNQAEQWYQALSIVRADLAIRLHHGSLDHSDRADTEALLKSGTLDCVVATSALDLGVDFQAVDRIFQIGSPRTVSRLMQRAGRARHRPGAASEVCLVPTHRLHLHEYAALADALDQGAIETIHPPEGCLDVLMQHLVTLALARSWSADAMYSEIISTSAYRALSRATFDALLHTLQFGSTALTQYPEFQRLIQDDQGQFRICNQTIARRHRMSIGTIVSDGQVRVKVRRGQTLGLVEEQFAARLKPGDLFRFAGRTLKAHTLRDGELLVTPARARADQEVPRWTGGRLPLSDTLARAVVSRFRASAPLSERITNRQWLKEALSHTASIQERVSQLPAPNSLLIERFQSRDGHHLFLYPFAGWLVHQTLGPLLAFRLAKHAEITLTITVNDYGIELLCASAEPLDQLCADWLRLIRPTGLDEDLDAAINITELSKRQFRVTARIAGWIFSGYPGQSKSNRALQTSASLLFTVLSDYDPEHVLLKQARTDVMQALCDGTRLRETCERLHGQDLFIHTLLKPSPLALPLMIERLSTRISSETLAARLARLTRHFDD